jgi:hypothetical protein
MREPASPPLRCAIPTVAFISAIGRVGRPERQPRAGDLRSCSWARLCRYRVIGLMWRRPGGDPRPHFTLNSACEELEVRAGATIAVDPKQRRLTRDQVFALRDPDTDDHCIILVDDVRAANKAAGRAWEVVGRVMH